MAMTIGPRFGAGGANLQPGGTNGPSLADALMGIIDDITATRAAVVALVAKLDADAGVTDTNYAATCTPAAQTVTKGTF